MRKIVVKHRQKAGKAHLSDSPLVLVPDRRLQPRDLPQVRVLAHDRRQLMEHFFSVFRE